MTDEFKFEAGKKYQRKDKSTKPFEILWVSSNNSEKFVFRYLHEFTERFHESSNWADIEYEEYVEPKKYYQNIYKHTNSKMWGGDLCTSEEIAAKNRYGTVMEYVKTIEVIL